MVRRIRADDVAKIAGVSRSTVSRVFTPGAVVAEDTRVKVTAAADLIGYRLNIIARSLTMRRTRLIGVVVGDLFNPFYAELLARISRILQDRGLAALLFRARYDEIEQVMRHLMSYQIDGMIVTSAVPTSGIAAEFSKIGTPIVVINRPSYSELVHSVASDNFVGTELVAEHLADLGCSRIAYIAGIPGLPSNDEREQGLIKALSGRRVGLFARDVGDYTSEGAAAATRMLLNRTIRPDAIFCANDTMAVATIDVARHEFGLRPGLDLRIVGYGNGPIAKLAGYDLTSVDQDVDAIAAHAVDLAETSLADNAAGGLSIRIPPRLVVRSSTQGS